MDRTATPLAPVAYTLAPSAYPVACMLRGRWLGESIARIARHYPALAAALSAAGEEAIANVQRAAQHAPVNAPALLRVVDGLCEEAAQLDQLLRPA
jgi:hypothetical protein